MLSIFKPAPHKARLPATEIDPTYRRLRWQIFLGIFFGYAAYYLVRKNFALAMPYLVEQGFSRGDLGFALSGISIAYGFSKFIMGSVSDRSNPRVFLPAGLILAAAVMLFMGFVPWATSSIAIMFVLLFLCGWFQGMGWPPCGRTMVHWWSQKERGGIVSVWNCAHNVGGGLPPLLFLLGMAWFNDWKAALYMPAFGAIVVALFAFAMMRDTPQSCGLPPIEEYKNDYPDDYNEKAEEELTAKQIFMQYVLPNKLLWYIAIANVFVYLLRYGILDWSPTYLKEVKHFALDKSSWAYFLYEYLFHRVGFCNDHAQVRNDPPSNRGELNVFTALADKTFDSQLFFKRRNGLAYSGLGHIQPLTGFGKTAAFKHGKQGVDLG